MSEAREIIAAGVHEGLPAERYHKAEGVSHSMLKAMHPKPAHLLAYMQEEREPSAAMIMGTLTHDRVLEPDKPAKRLAVKPEDMKFSTKEGKAWKAEAEAAGQLVIKEADFRAVNGMVASIAANKECLDIFAAECRNELSVFVPFSLGGTVMRRMRLDCVPVGNSLVDVKTCMNASPEAFSKALLPVDQDGMGYATQAAYYLDAWNDAVPSEPKSCFVFIAVEKRPPYLVALYHVEPRAIGAARRWNIDKLQTYIECKTSGLFPGYAAGIQPLDFPHWHYNRKGNGFSFAPR